MGESQCACLRGWVSKPCKKKTSQQICPEKRFRDASCMFKKAIKNSVILWHNLAGGERILISFIRGVVAQHGPREKQTWSWRKFRESNVFIREDWPFAVKGILINHRHIYIYIYTYISLYICIQANTHMHMAIQLQDQKTPLRVRLLSRTRTPSCRLTVFIKFLRVSAGMEDH